VVFGAGGSNFGKLETPLKIEPWSSQFGLGSIALSASFTGPLHCDARRSLIEDRVPLVAAARR